jgi:uncharacterized membrane protein YbhN (UPF0104 family)
MIMNVNSKIIRFIRVIATIVILLLFGIYIFFHINEFKSLLKIDPIYIILMLCLSFISMYANASQNALLYNVLGAQVGNLESVGISSIAAFFNLFIPQGTTIVKAVYLNHRYNIPYSKAPAFFLGILVIFLLVGSGFLLLSNMILLLMKETIPVIIWIFAIVVSFSGLLLIVDIPKTLFKKNKFINGLLANFSEGWRELRTNKSCIIKASFYQIIIFCCSGVSMAVAYRALGININPLFAISFSAVYLCSTILTIIPGNLGIQESIFGVLSSQMGLAFSQGVIMSTLIRLIVLSTLFVSFPVSWYFLFYRHGIVIRKMKISG